MKNYNTDYINNLVLAVASGDKSAFSKLYDEFSAPVYTYILKIVKNEDLAADILQDVFVKVWKNIPQFDVAKSKFFTWTINIAKNTALDAIKKKSYSSEIHNTV